MLQTNVRKLSVIVQKLVSNTLKSKGSILLIVAIWSLFLYSACSSGNSRQDEADRLNRLSYASRYKNLDSALIYARQAYDIAEKSEYNKGKAIALINESFYMSARMKYNDSDSLLALADSLTSNDNITSLIIEVNKMRLCQRRSKNKDFYFHKSAADRYIEKIKSHSHSLSKDDFDRYNYARIEYGIVLSAYLYYVQLYEESSAAMIEISEDNSISLLSDTAQYLGYLYSIGSGGVLKGSSDLEVQFKEFDYLMQCYIFARHNGYLFWEANALQSLSEHINNPSLMEIIRREDSACLRFLNDDDVSDSLLAGNLAQRSLQLFVIYGDLYQVAGAWRTLSQCYKSIGDHDAELSCLLNALSDSVVYQSPDLIASLDEKLSIAYSALNDKQMSDYHRNLYLDIQDSTRQDRQLEARIDDLSQLLYKTRVIMASVIILIVIMAVFIYVLIRRRKKYDYTSDHNKLLQPLKKWISMQQQAVEQLEEDMEITAEQLERVKIEAEDALRINVEQHAKISFVQNIMPLIDRMLHTINTDSKNNEENLSYVSDICTSILQYNTLLTKWVQLRKGQINLRIESFPLQQLFDVVKLSKGVFAMKQVKLAVDDTDIFIKADKTLTMFLINTILDNARKHTHAEGTVRLYASESSEQPGYADIVVADTGDGMTEEQVSHLFDYDIIDNHDENLIEQKSHGFGLMNCRGIIDRYKKTSELFHYCSISAKSKLHKGTSVQFRLPIVKKALLILLLIFTGYNLSSASNNEVSRFADLIYNSNINGDYSAALSYGDSCIMEFNKEYRKHTNANRADTLTVSYNGAELRWRRIGINIDYNTLVFVRNEMAVAALALHDWDIYERNNLAYTNLYKECSKDTTLNTYCETMESTERYYNYSVIVLCLLVIALIFIFWWFYVREQIQRKRSKYLLGQIFEFLLEDKEATKEDDCQKINISSSIKRIDEALSLLNEDNIASLTSDLHTVAASVKQSMNECKSNMLDILDRQRLLNEDIARLQRERDRLYVSNSIIDNTLSALKHETMYFPSRISAIVNDVKQNDDTTQGIDDLKETIAYYRNLYAMMSAQCSRNLKDITYPVKAMSIYDIGFDFTSQNKDIMVLANKQLINYLAVILKKKNNRTKPLASYTIRDNRYVNIAVQCPNLHMEDGNATDIFSSFSSDADYLIVKQILREIGSITNSFASGIRIDKSDEGSVIFIITLPTSPSHV